MRLKKIFQSVLLLAMTFSMTPVHAEETASPSAKPEETETDSAGEQLETKEEITVETPVPTTSPEATAVPTATPTPAATPAPTPTSTPTPTPTAEPSASSELSDDEILSRAGSEERAELYKGIQEYINEEIEKDPHFTMILTGSGTVEITDPDGIVTDYRWDSSEIKTGDDKGKKKDAETPYIFAINGEEGDVFHIKATADDKEDIDVFNVSDLTRPDEGTTVDVIAEKNEETGETSEYAELEYDIELKEHAYSELAVSFSEKNVQQTSPADLEQDKGVVESVIDRILNPTEAKAAGGTVSIIGWNSPNSGGTTAVYCDRFDLMSSTDATFQSYINDYVAAYGDYPYAACQNHGDYPPVNGSYSFEYKTTLLPTGEIQVDFTLNTRTLASTMWGNQAYFAKHPYTQGAAGSFKIPPRYRAVVLSVSKESANPTITSVSDYFTLEGAQYSAYSDAGCTNLLGTATTDSNGHAETTLDSVSTAVSILYVRETVAPRGFELDPAVHAVAISSANRAEVTSTETPQKFAVELLKTDENGNPQAGATLEVYTKNGILMDSWISTTSAHRISLDVGDYVLREKEAPAGYYLAEPVNFTVTPGTNVISVTMKDLPIQYAVDKIDKATGEPLAGVSLELRTIYGNVLDSWVTDGTAHTLPRELLKQGETYRIRETATVPGHYLLDKEIEFTVGSPTTEVVHITIDNPAISYGALKRDAITGEAISGVTLELRKKDGTVLDSWVTDGKLHVFEPSLLSVGETYYIHEAKTADGYYMNKEDVKFTIPTDVINVNTVEIVMEDYPIRYSIEKIDADTGNRLSGVVLGLYDSNGKELERWKTDANSTHTVSTKLQVSKTYYVQEIETIDGYYLNDQKVEFTVASSSSTSKEKGVIQVTVKNEPIEYYVLKRDAETKQAIAGIQMQLKDHDGNVVHSFVTSNLNPSGYHIPSQFLKAGETYTIHETEAINGYYYADDISFTVPKTLTEAKEQHNSRFTIIMYDSPIEYEFVKKDSSTGYQMAGVQLGIREVKDDGTTGDVFATWETDGKPYKIDSSLLTAGKTYELIEIRSVKGYYTANPVRFTVDKIKTDSKVVTITMNNTPIDWRIKKTDQNGVILTTENGQPFVLEVYDANGTQDVTADDVLIATLSTDDESYVANGYFKLSSELESGKIYRLHEAKAANGYAVEKDQYITIGSQPEGDGVISTSFENKEMTIRVYKVDEKGNRLDTYQDGNNSVGFQLGVFDEAGNQVCTLDTKSDEYSKNGYFNIAKYLEYGNTYTVKELNYPNGYYRANDMTFTLDETTVDAGPVEIRMIDPTIYVKFRKTDKEGNVLTTLVNPSGTEASFKFTVFDTMGTDTTSDDVAVCTIDTADAVKGDVSIGMYLKENTRYRFHETAAPQGYTLAEDTYVTTPIYYEG